MQTFFAQQSLPVTISLDTLTTVNLDQLQLNAAWWNSATYRLQIPAGFNTVVVQANGMWEYCVGGFVRRLVVQSQDLLRELADNVAPEFHEVYLTTNNIASVFWNPTLQPLSLMLGAYHDAPVPLQLFEVSLHVQCALVE
jgi:hypothetical protein